MELLLSVCLGIGLSAACGFRVFVPLLGINVAAMAGHLQLSAGFEWLGSPAACAVFLTATILEIAAYYVPWIDNALDTIATPAAAVAGTIAAAAVMTEMSPLLKWTLAVIAGGGTAGMVQTSTVAIRGVSTLATGGVTNFAVASGEWVLAGMLTILAFVVPMLVAGLVLICGFAAARYLFFRRSRSAVPVKATGRREPAGKF